MVDQTEERAADAESPVNDPYAKDVLLLFIENAFKSGEDGSAAHEKETEVIWSAAKISEERKMAKRPGCFTTVMRLRFP